MILVYTVCLCPSKRTLGLNGLIKIIIININYITYYYGRGSVVVVVGACVVLLAQRPSTAETITKKITYTYEPLYM